MRKLLYHKGFPAVLEHKPAASSAENTGFEKRIMSELHILSLKMDDLTESMNILLQNKAEVTNNPEYNEVPDVIPLSLPVNENSLAELENWLMSSDQNKTALSLNFSRIGGCNVKEVVRRIMYHVFTNEVGMSYSWEGAKKKKIFKNLAVTSCIFTAIRLNENAKDCTDVEIITLIKAWLVRSKDRFDNYLRKLNNENNPEPSVIEPIPVVKME